jgi:hypothetical protein
MNGRSRFLSFTTTIKTLCQCEKFGFFVASDLANMIGQGRTFESLKSRCKECDVADCDGVPYEADRDRVNKKRVVFRYRFSAPRISLNTAGALIDNAHNLRADCCSCRHCVKLDLEALQLGRITASS